MTSADTLVCLPARASCRERYESAYLRFASLASRFSAYNWTALEAFYLIKALETHSLLGKARDAEWVGKVLALLRCLVRVGFSSEASVWEGEAGGLASFVGKLIADMREAGKALEKGPSSAIISGGDGGR